MTLKARRLLYITFILLFLIITPLISLYASGYKLGNGFRVEKTGILILDTEPNSAKIYIDDEAEQKFWTKYIDSEASYIRTPAKIKNILPGEYFVKMEIEGYWPWQKKLTVEPGQSTYAEDVTLFKKDTPIFVEPGNFDSAHRNDDFFVLNSGGEINIFDLKHETTISSLEGKNTAPLSWSSDKKHFIYNKHLYSAGDNKAILNLDQITGNNTKSISFSQNNPKEIIFLSDQGLSSFQLENYKVSQLIKNPNIQAWSEKNGRIFFVQKTNFSCELVIWDKNKQKISRQISLPISDYLFSNKNHSLVNLYDKKHEILFIIDPSSPIRALKETVNNANKHEWVDDQTLVYANDFEIWLYDLASQSKVLLTRISEKIDQIIWHPSNNYVLFSTNHKINILELDNREKRNITELISLKNINDPILTNDGEILYFLAEIGKQKGLFKLFIQ